MEEFSGTEMAILLVTISNLLLVVTLALIAFRPYFAKTVSRGEKNEVAPLIDEATEATENPATAARGDVVLIDERRFSR